MSAATATVTIVLFVLFLSGVAVGFLVVTALSARRADKALRLVSPASPHPGQWPHPPAAGPDDTPDEPGWWHGRGGD
jgi:Flp pilus assembly protein protease CpaA